jgi:D-alanyl-D-alanine dipeptidase/carboxypeptidase
MYLLHKSNIHTGNLILINARHPIVCKENIRASQLVHLDREDENVLLHMKTAKQYLKLCEAVGESGQIVLISGYRSFAEQTQIYANSLKMNGEAFTKQYVALPNCSEHQSGLAIDVAKNEEKIDSICPNFPYEGIYGEFRNQAAAYGFIQRYEKEKESITNIAQEPWHFRYVGIPHASFIKQHRLCLEEYVVYLKEFEYHKKHLVIKEGKRRAEIAYIAQENAANAELPKKRCFEISGNNVDGFILTLWRKS